MPELPRRRAYCAAARPSQRVTSADQEQVRLILKEEMISLFRPNMERGSVHPKVSTWPTFILVAGDSDSDRALVIEGLCGILSKRHKTAALVGVDARSATGIRLVRRKAQATGMLTVSRTFQAAGYLSAKRHLCTRGPTP